MYTKQNILIFGQNQECQEVVLLLKNKLLFRQQQVQYYTTCDYDEIYKQIVDANPNLVIVLADGANGMECVYNVKEYNKNIPVFWFSDDRKFGLHSHRLECAYFAEKPLTTVKLDKAFSRCKNLGIQILAY